MKRRNRSSKRSDPPRRAVITQRAGFTRLAVATFVCSIAVLSLHAWYYHRFMVDDAFISLRYGASLVVALDDGCVNLGGDQMYLH